MQNSRYKTKTWHGKGLRHKWIRYLKTWWIYRLYLRFSGVFFLLPSWHSCIWPRCLREYWVLENSFATLDISDLFASPGQWCIMYQWQVKMAISKNTEDPLTTFTYRLLHCSELIISFTLKTRLSVLHWGPFSSLREL